ncbi:MAG: bifunctional 23S rRNA (guanine(2069)-N(7))-methyltransferase RlmK/23S rRNA (guanine(2445)-N(2))-methyltransferase RlmL, partial [Deltaproteobacteria bacterium]|nr:bifunctional 23S rRNA (guanine(2069)-N(7))-methyltransferase RlmK/23S rRNA (guanine(2445)-N(2))-methyltransferase RlmL [Deltaproteobacteria bacterium]
VHGCGGTAVTESAGAVTFEGSLEAAYRVCLWSRFASRLFMPLAVVQAGDADELYRQALAMDWSPHLSPEHTFAVDCTVSSDQKLHSRFAALRIKDAIADKFLNTGGRRPSVQVTRPDVQVHAYCDNDGITLSLDLSGEALHRRGYRAEGGNAPLKETLAAALVHLAGWPAVCSPAAALVDPMCGSGTLLIEAAMMYGDVAPGLSRPYYGFLKWPGHDAALWDRLIREATAREEQGTHRRWPRFIGYDADRATVHAALQNIERAGLSGRVHAERSALAGFDKHVFGGSDGLQGEGMVIVNPPYGERLAAADEIKYLYRCLGRKLKEACAGWRAGIFIANPDLIDMFGLELRNRYRLYNGPIPCQLCAFDVPAGKEVPETEPVLALSGQGTGDFANRLRKNIKKLTKWAAREGVTCYRLYDADMPEYNVAVDVYGHWISVQEYAPPATVDEDKAVSRLRGACDAVQQVLGVKRNRILIKQRRRQKGRSQYQKQREKGRLHEVQEGACRFLVNLTDYIDTGIFLDHRMTRRMLGDAAEGKRFLNLFGYTGTATVHAAMGGAKYSVTVDRSAVYLAWAQSNLALNGFCAADHKAVRADVLAWLKKSRAQFDLIFADPPTFSNAKKRKEIFDVQEDHVELIRLAMRRLAPDGLLVFSNNYRRFKLSPDLQDTYAIRDITPQTIPRDFERQPNIHHCWEIRHREKKNVKGEA